MEGLINFLEENWGVTIVGGITVGSLIMFSISAIKMFLRDKIRNREVNAVVSDVLTKAENAVISVTDRYNKTEKENRRLRAENEYLQRVVTSTFKAISYLTMASKLPTEEKIVLQSEFTALLTPHKEQTVNDRVEEVVEEAVEETKQDVTEVVKEVVEKAGNLLDKYIGG
jgi:uncharacterized protein YueI